VTSLRGTNHEPSRDYSHPIEEQNLVELMKITGNSAGSVT
jgi:hypothetical protein